MPIPRRPPSRRSPEIINLWNLGALQSRIASSLVNRLPTRFGTIREREHDQPELHSQFSGSSTNLHLWKGVRTFALIPHVRMRNTVGGWIGRRLRPRASAANVEELGRVGRGGRRYRRAASAYPYCGYPPYPSCCWGNAKGADSVEQGSNKSADRRRPIWKTE